MTGPAILHANYLVHRAITQGVLTRPTHCEECGKECHPQGAHYDYRRPLDVRWLCVSCHKRWDIAEPKSHTAELVEGASTKGCHKVQCNLPPTLLVRIRVLAEAERRSVSNMLSVLVERGLSSYVDQTGGLPVETIQPEKEAAAA
jgi:hypothetical protein